MAQARQTNIEQVKLVLKSYIEALDSDLSTHYNLQFALAFQPQVKLEAEKSKTLLRKILSAVSEFHDSLVLNGFNLEVSPYSEADENLTNKIQEIFNAKQALIAPKKIEKPSLQAVQAVEESKAGAPKPAIEVVK